MAEGPDSQSPAPQSPDRGRQDAAGPDAGEPGAGEPGAATPDPARSGAATPDAAPLVAAPSDAPASDAGATDALPPSPTPDPSPDTLTENPWRVLRRFTDARIGLGRVGVSLPTREWLAFQMAHAQARDAVHLPLNTQRLADDLRGIEGLAAPVTVASQATDRDDYLRHPPKGGRLRNGDAARLTGGGTPGDDLTGDGADPAPDDAPDLALVIVDGLSSRAVQDNTVPFLRALMAALPDLRLSAPVIVTQGRVAIGDPIGSALRARAVLVMIGERPGLSSPDSLGLYFTWGPQIGFHDARRNCISNVRPAGLDYDRAARRAAYLYRGARELGASGVALKDRSSDDSIGTAPRATSFLSPPDPQEPS